MTILSLAWAAQVSFASYTVSPDLHEVVNLKKFLAAAPLARAHRQKLAENLFTVAPADMREIQYVYGQNDYEEVPSLVTTDTVLHLFHVSFDSTLRNMEQGPLYDRVGDLTRKALAGAVELRGTRTTPEGRGAATRAIAYFGVADRLLGQTSPLPADVKAAVGEEMLAVKAAQGLETSRVVPSKIDFSQFIVRGHYNRSPRLQRYFRAMMWYGLAPIELVSGLGELRPEGVRMAVAVSETVSRARLQGAWTAVYEPTTLFAGTVNSLTPLMGIHVLEKLGGNPEQIDPSRCAEELAKLDPSIYRPSLRIQTGIATGLQLRFMGQRGLLDGWVISRVTGPDRPLPTGLDVMAALGSPAAWRIVQASPEIFNPMSWSDYLPRLTEAKATIAAVPGPDWTKNLYLGWLGVLRAKVAQPAHKLPAFMSGRAWSDLSMHGALASWAQLRHDTILYGEQTVSEMGDGDEDQPILRGFVEPNLPFYERLTALASQLRAGLLARNLIDEDARRSLDSLVELVQFLHSCARKEVAGVKLGADEHLRIRRIEGEIESIVVDMLMRGMEFQQLTLDDRDMALVADVHTASPLALTVACGHADDLIAVVPIEGKLYLARGPVFSYYEFVVPTSERMTDESWKALLGEGKAPPRPSWISSFFVPIAARPPDR